jgi:hypothetical protein
MMSALREKISKMVITLLSVKLSKIDYSSLSGWARPAQSSASDLQSLAEVISWLASENETVRDAALLSQAACRVMVFIVYLLRPAGVHWEEEHQPNFASEDDERRTFTRDVNQFTSEVASIYFIYFIDCHVTSLW